MIEREKKMRMNKTETSQAVAHSSDGHSREGGTRPKPGARTTFWSPTSMSGTQACVTPSIAFLGPLAGIQRGSKVARTQTSTPIW